MTPKENRPLNPGPEPQDPKAVKPKTPNPKSQTSPRAYTPNLKSCNPKSKPQPWNPKPKKPVSRLQDLSQLPHHRVNKMRLPRLGRSAVEAFRVYRVDKA